MSGAERLGRRGLDALKASLTDRDLAITSMVAELRLMTRRQIAAVHFAADDFPSTLAAVRACNRCLDRLSRQRVLVRLQRQIGGVRGGSSSFIHSLGPVGARLLGLDGPRRRFREPSERFVDHTLTVTQLLVNLMTSGRVGSCDVLDLQAEPRCWRSFQSPSGRVLLRPDAFAALGVGEYEHRFFIEVDRGSEHLPALIRKCRIYESYFASGKEQAAFGVFPRVCWLMPSLERAARLRDALREGAHLTPALHLITTEEDVLSILTGGAS